MDYGKLKIGDLGFSKNVSKMSKKTSKCPGTVNYMSPELIRQEVEYTNKIDIWALGCVIFEIVTLRILFDGKFDYEIQTKIMTGEIIFPDQTDAKIKQILTG
jgi:serine/threonine protein kinase